MNGERARHVAVEHRLEQIPLIAPKAAPRPATESRLANIRTWLAERWTVALGIGWPVVVVVAMSLEPAPADPEAAGPLLVELASIGFLVLVAAVAAAGLRRDAGVASLAAIAGAVALVFTVSCPLSGHHAGIGAWWFGQMALVTAMTAVSVVAWRRSRA